MPINRSLGMFSLPTFVGSFGSGGTNFFLNLSVLSNIFLFDLCCPSCFFFFFFCFFLLTQPRGLGPKWEPAYKRKDNPHKWEGSPHTREEVACMGFKPWAVRWEPSLLTTQVRSHSRVLPSLELHTEATKGEKNYWPMIIQPNQERLANCMNFPLCGLPVQLR